MTSFSLRSFLRSFFLVSAALTCLFFIDALSVKAGHGSGTMSVNTTSTIAGSTGNTFTFTYATTEPFADGGMRLTMPTGWSAPTTTIGVAGYTTVSVSTGTTATLIDSLDSNSAWDDNSILMATTDDFLVKYEGSGSLAATIVAGIGRGKVYKNTGAARNFSGYNKVSFWVRSDAIATDGDVRFILSETTNAGTLTEVYNLPALPANTWTQVIIPLSGTTTTRDAVLSYGFDFNLALVSVYHFDALSFGPGAPVFSGQTVELPFLQAPSGTIVTVTYGAGGGASGATAPTSTAVATFVASDRINSSGSFTSLVSGSPTVAIQSATCTRLGVTGGATGVAGLVNELTVTAYDIYGNVCASGPNAYQGSKTLTFSGPNASLDGSMPTVEGIAIGTTTTVAFTSGASVAGSASFIPTQATTATIQVTDGALNSSLSTAFSTVSAAGSAAKLAFSAVPVATVLGTNLTPTPTVLVQDAYGNTTSSSATVRVGLNTNPGLATLSGTLTRTASAGTATFTGLSLNVVGVGYSLIATSTGLTSATTSLFSNTPSICTYASVGTSNWNALGNWSCGHVPTTSDEVVIPASTSTVLSSTGSMNSLSVGAGATVSAAGFSLGVVATTTIETGATVTSTSGTLSFTGPVTVNGSLGSNTGNLLFSTTTTIVAGGSLRLGTGIVTSTGALVNAGTIYGNAGQLVLLDAWTNTGTFQSGSSTVWLRGSLAQVIPSLLDVYHLIVDKTAGAATLSGTVTSTGVVTLRQGTLNAGTGTLILSGSGTPLVSTGGSFVAASGTVMYTNPGTVTIAPLVYQDLRLTGTGATYGLSASTTVLGSMTMVSSTLLIGTNVLTAVGALNHVGTITQNTLGGGTIMHAAESVKLTDADGVEVSTIGAPAGLYVTLQDANLNLLSASTETVSVTVSTNAAAGSDSETLVLTETATSSGIFRNTTPLPLLNSSVATSNGRVEIAAAGVATVLYVDPQHSADTTSDSVPVSTSGSSGAGGNSGGNGGGGGGSNGGGSGGGSSGGSVSTVPVSPTSTSTPAFVNTSNSGGGTSHSLPSSSSSQGGQTGSIVLMNDGAALTTNRQVRLSFVALLPQNG